MQSVHRWLLVNTASIRRQNKAIADIGLSLRADIGADSTGATGNFAPVLTQEPGQTLRFAPVPFMAML